MRYGGSIKGSQCRWADHKAWAGATCSGFLLSRPPYLHDSNAECCFKSSLRAPFGSLYAHVSLDFTSRMKLLSRKKFMLFH